MKRLLALCLLFFFSIHRRIISFPSLLQTIVFIISFFSTIHDIILNLSLDRSLVTKLWQISMNYGNFLALVLDQISRNFWCPSPPKSWYFTSQHCLFLWGFFVLYYVRPKEIVQFVKREIKNVMTFNIQTLAGPIKRHVPIWDVSQFVQFGRIYPSIGNLTVGFVVILGPWCGYFGHLVQFLSIYKLLLLGFPTVRQFPYVSPFYMLFCLFVGGRIGLFDIWCCGGTRSVGRCAFRFLSQPLCSASLLPPLSLNLYSLVKCIILVRMCRDIHQEVEATTAYPMAQFNW